MQTSDIRLWDGLIVNVYMENYHNFSNPVAVSTLEALAKIFSAKSDVNAIKFALGTRRMSQD